MRTQSQNRLGVRYDTATKNRQLEDRIKVEKVSTMLVVADLAVSKQFYVDVLGLTIQSEYPGRIYFTLGDHPIAMFQGEGPAVASEHADDANSTLIFSTKNLDEKIAQMKSQGVEFLDEEPNDQPWGRYLAFKDPSGIVHEVFELGSEQSL